MTTQTESQSIAIQRAMIADLRRDCAAAKAETVEANDTINTLVAVIAILTHGHTAVVWDADISALIAAGTALTAEDNGGGGWILRTKKGTENDRS